MMAPILVFTAEEIWYTIPKEKKYSSVESVHLLDFPQVNSVFAQAGLESGGGKNIDQELKVIIELIPEVAKVLEEKRQKGEIGSSFDAKIKLLTNNIERYTFLASLKDDLCEIFKVSQVEIEKQDKLDSDISSVVDFPDISIVASKASGTKCVRCWNYELTVGESKIHPLICRRCEDAIGEE
jgi:isoleucyl-tRNA synthetase